MAEKIELGCTAKDRISGFTGVVTGTAYYLTGCNQALVAPTKLKEDGSTLDSHWYDFQRLERVDAPLVSFDNGATPGADKPAPKR